MWLFTLALSRGRYGTVARYVAVFVRDLDLAREKRERKKRKTEKGVRDERLGGFDFPRNLSPSLTIAQSLHAEVVFFDV